MIAFLAHHRLRRLLALLVLLAALFRYHALFANTFHADEALFASFARHVAVWRDPLLQSQPLDKSPLLFYLQALFYPLFGPVQWAARLPNFLASLLLVPLTGRLVHRLYGDELAALLAAAVVALSPYTIQFSATAFTDSLLTTFIVASLFTASRPQSKIALAGFFFGLALATKHQAALFLPLVLALPSLAHGPCPPSRRWRPLLAGLLPVLLLLFAWQLARSGDLRLWPDQLAAYGGLRPAWSWELWPRLSAWGELWGYVLGSSVQAFFLLLALPPFLALLIHDQDRPAALDQLFLLFLVGYVLLHWFLAVPIWDRYLLPAVPIAALLLGRFASRLLAFVRPSLPLSAAGLRRLPAALLLLFVLTQLPLAAQARLGRFPIGGQPAADRGAAEVAAALAAAPPGAVLYDHWHSWHWRYHLFDRPLYVSWFPHPQALASDLAVFGRAGPARYLVLPVGDQALPVIRAVRDAGFTLRPMLITRPPASSPGLTLYEVLPR